MAGAERGRYVPGSWAPDPGAQSRRARRGIHYLAFVPEPISDMAVDLPSGLAADLEEAALAIARLNGPAREPGSLEGVARQLLRSESLASSRIEGLEMGHRRIALADFDERVPDAKAADILGNIRAMQQAIEIAAGPDPIDPDALLEIHRTLLRFGVDEPIAGRWRDRQGWIGGMYPENAVYVPPPPEEVPGLVDDLCELLQRDDMPALLQAAIAHAQFETIHPFIDGNGRVGRCLIQAVLRRRGLTPLYVPPISLILASNRDAYFAGLEAYRRWEGIPEWAGFFADAATMAAIAAGRLAAEIQSLQERWRERFANRLRSDAATWRVLAMLPAHPVLNVPIVTRELGISDRAAGEALRQLEDAGIVRLVTRRVRGRLWECPGMFALVQEFENSLRFPGARGASARPADRPT
jgi:Fic family protein